jgi:hypothetical protein
VLLVRDRRSSDLYALKAITKRHVLAHLELQHTLTKQAVLRRMAAKGTDPFVVKLWWSFHDKENVFLVWYVWRAYLPERSDGPRVTGARRLGVPFRGPSDGKYIGRKQKPDRQTNVRGDTSAQKDRV